MKLIFSSIFESDFAELVGYFSAQAGDKVSTRFEDSVCQIVELLVKSPELGRLRRDLKPNGIRSFAIPQFRTYILFYRTSGSDLIFLRVRLGGMDLPGLL